MCTAGRRAGTGSAPAGWPAGRNAAADGTLPLIDIWPDGRRTVGGPDGMGRATKVNMIDTARATVRGKWTEWRRQRQEQAATSALEAAGIFEREQIAWMYNTVQSTKDTAEAALVESHNLSEQAISYLQAASEHQKDAWRAREEYEAATQRGPDGKEAAAAAAWKVAEAWKAAATAASTESDLWKAAAAAAWKAAAAASECVNTSEAVIKVSADNANMAKSQEYTKEDREAVAARVKIAQETKKNAKAWADEGMKIINDAIIYSEQKRAKGAAWAAAAARMAKEWTAVWTDAQAAAEPDAGGRTAV